MRVMGRRAAAWLAWSMLALCALLASLSVFLNSRYAVGSARFTTGDLVWVVAFLGFPTVGAFIAARRRPGGGWPPRFSSGCCRSWDLERSSPGRSGAAVVGVEVQPGSGPLWVFANAGFSLMVVALFAVLSLLLRFRSAEESGRQQTKWLAYAGAPQDRQDSREGRRQLRLRARRRPAARVGELRHGGK